MSDARQMMEQAGAKTIHDTGFANQCIKKWGPMLESAGQNDPIQNPYTKRVTAVLLENEMEHLKSLNEDTMTTNTGHFTKYIFPILRRVWPNLIANQVVSVQPMTSPVSGIFYYEKKYDNAKGSKTQAGGISGVPTDMNYEGQMNADDNMQENFGRYYSSEFVDYDAVCSDTGTATATLDQADTNCAITGWSPIRDNGVSGQRTFYVKAFYRQVSGDEVIATMNNAGKLVDNTSGANEVGDFNISTGAWDITPKTSAGVATNFVNNTVVYFQYFVNWEKVGYTSGAEIPSISLDIKLHTVVAESRKLKARWTVEAVDDMRALHGMEIESEIVSSFANEVMLEVDREIIDGLVGGAKHSTSYAYASSIPGELESIRELITKISAMSARIHTASNRAPANFIVAPPAVVALLDQLSTHGDFASIESNIQSPSNDLNTANYGISRVGTLLRKWAVYSDPFMAGDKVLVGLKGSSFLDAGFVYAPYVPLQVTPTFMDPDDFTFRKGVRTRYATKMLRSEFYGTINVSGLPTVVSS